jgi:hypothetical protein
MKRVVMTLIVIIAAGCEQEMVWNKPGVTEAEFNVDRYQCMASSQQQSSSIYVGRYGGYGSSSQTTNAPLFNACMTARGYSLAAPRSNVKAVDLEEIVNCKYFTENGVVKRVSRRTCATTQGMIQPG